MPQGSKRGFKAAIRKAIPKPIRTGLESLRDRRRQQQAEDAVARFPLVSFRKPHGLPGELVVSLTSYPKRFPTLAKTLKSLLDQTVKPDRTVLWLAQGDIPPPDIAALEAHGLEIRFCEDLRSYKKIIPSLREWPAAYVAIADDDTYYAPDWLELLVSGSEPGVVSCRRAHRVRRVNGSMAPYVTWEWNIIGRGEVDDLFPTGCGGVLYPPGSLAPEVFDEGTFQRICPDADDVWLYMMARRAGTLYRQVGGGFNNTSWPGSQAESLLTINIDGGNDRQIAAVEAHLAAAQ